MNPPMNGLSRLRATQASRNLLQETRLHPHQFIAPLFISAKLTQRQPIHAMPGQYQLSLADLPTAVAELAAVGIQAVLLFGIPTSKDACGRAALQDDGIIQQAIRRIRACQPNMLIITDLCFCEYTDHGHCGALAGERLDMEATRQLLAEQAISHARAGADWIAPSGMIDGMVSSIRQALDGAGFSRVAILSYSAKYCSALYGPFREAAEGAPQFGNRKTYQMDPANGQEGLRETAADIAEGADMVMVKPAGFYLDVINQIKQAFPDVPLCAYQVSGEYSMIKQAATAGLIDEEAVMLESLIAIKRAGADLIITYFARDIAEYLKARMDCI